MLGQFGRPVLVTRRSPHGERGLKFLFSLLLQLEPESLPARGAWIEMEHRQYLAQCVVVAPRTGSVD